MGTELVIWLDAPTLRALPALDGELGRAGATVMRSFGRVPQANMAQRVNGGAAQAAVVSGRDLRELLQRIELATLTLHMPVIAALPQGISPEAVPRRAGLVDVLPWGAKDVSQRILLMSRVPIVRPVSSGAARRSVVAEAGAGPAAATGAGPILVVASSTGGLLVLVQVLQQVRADAFRGVLVAQHMDADFVPLFAQWLGEASGWPTGIIDGRGPLQPGRVQVPSGGSDLVVQGGALLTQPASSRYVPSADRLFTSAAEAFGPDVVGLVLSGMGEDGARGAAEVVRRGGRVLCQSPAEAIVPAMPTAALRMSAQALSLPVAQLANALGG